MKLTKICASILICSLLSSCASYSRTQSYFLYPQTKTPLQYFYLGSWDRDMVFPLKHENAAVTLIAPDLGKEDTLFLGVNAIFFPLTIIPWFWPYGILTSKEVSPSESKGLRVPVFVTARGKSLKVDPTSGFLEFHDKKLSPYRVKVTEMGAQYRKWDLKPSEILELPNGATYEIEYFFKLEGDEFDETVSFQPPTISTDSEKLVPSPVTMFYKRLSYFMGFPGA